MKNLRTTQRILLLLLALLLPFNTVAATIMQLCASEVVSTRIQANTPHAHDDSHNPTQASPQAHDHHNLNKACKIACEKCSVCGQAMNANRLLSLSPSVPAIEPHPPQPLSIKHHTPQPPERPPRQHV